MNLRIRVLVHGGNSSKIEQIPEISFDSSYCLYQVELEGLTGNIKFDQQGLRTEFTLQIVELKKHGLEKVKLYFI